MTAATPPPAPARLARELGGLALLGVTVGFAALFAHAFRSSLVRGVEFLSGEEDATLGVAALRRPAAFALIVIGITVAAVIARAARRRAGPRIGLKAIHAVTTGAGPGPELAPTLTTAAGTWAASAAMTSVGRETAIIDVSGTIGATLGRRWADFAPCLAAAGVAAAFASAYHAPIAAAIYVEGHIGVRQNRRTLAYVIIAAGVGHLVTVKLLDGTAIFPGRQDSWASTLALAAIAILPAVLGSRAFLELRNRLALPATGRPRLAAAAALAIASAALVVWFPLSAGNGMEGLRNTAVAATASAGLALGIVKLVATTAALRAGVHGGVISPSLAVAAGWALLTFAALEQLGLDLPGSRWDGMLAAMAVGVAVSLDAPILAAALIAEMAGELSLIPLCAAVAVAATRVDAWVAATGLWRAPLFNRRLRNEDA